MIFDLDTCEKMPSLKFIKVARFLKYPLGIVAVFAGSTSGTDKT
jgi:hypothetical protein